MSKSENSENIEEVASQATNLTDNFVLPEVSQQSLDYHDEAELATITLNENAETGDALTESEVNILPDPTAVSAPVYMEDEREKSRGLLDDKDKPFDPSMHKFPPEKTGSGIWKKLPKADREKIDPDNGKTILPVETNLKCKRDADKSARFYDTVHVMFLGPEAKGAPEQISALSDSFEKYYQENGAIEIPAHWELALSCLDHTTEIIKRPSVLDKVMFYGKVLYVKAMCKIKGITIKGVAEESKPKSDE